MRAATPHVSITAQHKDILSKGQEKISVAERTEEMVQVELDKLGEQEKKRQAYAADRQVRPMQSS